jgi:hypothetical protein
MVVHLKVKFKCFQFKIVQQQITKSKGLIPNCTVRFMVDSCDLGGKAAAVNPDEGVSSVASLLALNVSCFQNRHPDEVLFLLHIK